MGTNTKQVLLFIAIFIAVFFSALFGANFVLERIWKEKDYYFMQISKPIDIQYLVANAISTVERLENNNEEEIYKHSCVILMQFAKYLNSEDYRNDPLKSAEIKELEIKAKKTEQRLRNKGLCPE